MKRYVIVTGTVFGLITMAHIWRGVEEGARVAADPWFVALTVAVAALCLWAVLLLWRWPRA